MSLSERRALVKTHILKTLLRLKITCTAQGMKKVKPSQNDVIYEQPSTPFHTDLQMEMIVVCHAKGDDTRVQIIFMPNAFSWKL